MCFNVFYRYYGFGLSLNIIFILLTYWCIGPYYWLIFYRLSYGLIFLVMILTLEFLFMCAFELLDLLVKVTYFGFPTSQTLYDNLFFISSLIWTNNVFLCVSLLFTTHFASTSTTIICRCIPVVQQWRFWRIFILKSCFTASCISSVSLFT